MSLIRKNVNGPVQDLLDGALCVLQTKTAAPKSLRAAAAKEKSREPAAENDDDIDDDDDEEEEEEEPAPPTDAPPKVFRFFFFLGIFQKIVCLFFFNLG